MIVSGSVYNITQCNQFYLFITVRLGGQWLVQEIIIETVINIRVIYLTRNIGNVRIMCIVTIIVRVLNLEKIYIFVHSKLVWLQLYPSRQSTYQKLVGFLLDIWCLYNYTLLWQHHIDNWYTLSANYVIKVHHLS